MKSFYKIFIVLAALILVMGAVGMTVFAEDTGEEAPTYVVQVESGIDSVVISNRTKVHKGDVIDLPLENDRLYSTTYFSKRGYHLAGYMVRVGTVTIDGKNRNAYLGIEGEEGTFVDSATGLTFTIYYDKAVLFQPGELTLKEEYILATPLGGRAFVYAVWLPDVHNISASFDGVNVPMFDKDGNERFTCVSDEKIILPDMPASANDPSCEFMWQIDGMNYGPGTEFKVACYGDKNYEISVSGVKVPKKNQFNLIYMIDENGTFRPEYAPETGIDGALSGVLTYNYGTPVDEVLVDPTEREGFIFNGWFSDADCTVPVTDSDTASESYKNVYGKWTPDPDYRYSVSFEGIDAVETPAYNDTLTIPEPSEEMLNEHIGYTFAGWQGNGAVYIPGQVLTVRESQTLTATWQPVPYTLTIITDTSTDRRTQYAGEISTIGVRTRAEYTFLGWYDENDELFSTDGKFIMPNNDLTLTAKFAPAFHTVTYVNPINNTESTARVAFDAPLKLPTAAEINGYAFEGWMRADKTFAQNGDILTSDITLTASYKETTQYITVVNGVTGESQRLELTEGMKLPVPKEIAGYTFVGWKNSEDNDVAADESLVADGTYTAVYKELEWLITVVNSATGEISSYTVKRGESFTLPEVDAPEGYLFLAWLDEDGVEIKDGSITPEKDIRITCSFNFKEPEVKDNTVLRTVSIILISVGGVAVCTGTVVAVVFRKKLFGNKATGTDNEVHDSENDDSANK